ncbi:vesicle transport v-snare protein vti1 [Flagelloscypha sp. PMI_526]|nr:vesicle transport v-snare protein vti1 [Flagelloscypha sp. PMI_526]
MSDITPASNFSQYAEDLSLSIDEITNKLDEAAQGDDNVRMTAHRSLTPLLEDAADLLAQLHLELQGIPNSVRPPYSTQYKALEKNLEGLKKRVLTLKTSSGGANKGNFKSYGEDQRSQLLAGNQTLHQSSNRLTSSIGVALDTEAQGAEILTNLRGQREQIEHAREMLDTSDQHINRAGGTITRMIRQMYKQRVIYALLALVLVVVIVLVLYFKLR